MSDDDRHAGRAATATRDSLVERLDPALGEASSGIGVLLSELVRRTLRGGIAKIEEEMEDFVGEKVDLTVADRMPEFQDAATKTASERAGLIANQAVHQIREETDGRAKQLTDELANVREHTEESIQRASADAIAAVKDVQTETRETSDRLSSDIAQTGQQAEARARQMLAEHDTRLSGRWDSQLADLKKRSQSTYADVQAKLGDLQEKSSALLEKLNSEVQARQSEMQRLQTTLERVAARNSELEARLAQLEQPRGLRKVLGSLFKKKPKALPAPEHQVEPEAPQ